jgi:hypothetical protein
LKFLIKFFFKSRHGGRSIEKGSGQAWPNE